MDSRNRNMCHHNKNDDDGEDRVEEPEDAITQTGETMEVDSSVKPGVEIMPPEILEVKDV
jgi:hypothetical protein